MGGWLPLKSFISMLEEAVSEKRSVLCLGLDPAMPGEREEHVASRSYLDGRSLEEAKLQFCLDLIEELHMYFAAVKVNEQYVRGLSSSQLSSIAKEARRHGLVSIYDCKLGDIGASAKMGVLSVARLGFDAITVNPLSGNLESVVRYAHQHGIAVISLVLMSNPEAARYMKEAELRGEPLYMAFARDVCYSDADGCVVGATGHVKPEEIRAVREAIGAGRVILSPGVGAQGGDLRKAIRYAGRPLLVNVGRAVIYAKSPKEAAERMWRASLGSSSLA